MVMATKEAMEAPTRIKDMTLLHLTHVSVSAEWYSSVAQTRSALHPVRSARGVKPGSQEVQKVEPSVIATLSESHAVQVDSPAAEENFPDTQGVHVVLLVAPVFSEYFPESQSLHVATLVAAVAPEYFPETQLVHEEAPASENFPT